MIVFWVRHGQTRANLEQRFQGVTDYPLDATGRRQVLALQRRFAGLPLRAIYASPLGRARETAELIAACHRLEVEAEADLREMDFGLWEGQPFHQVRERDPDRMAAWQERPDRVAPVGGETVAEVLLRVRPLVERWQRRWREDDLVLAVSHVVPIKAAVLDALGLDLQRQDRFRLDVASVTTLVYHPQRTILAGFNERPGE